MTLIERLRDVKLCDEQHKACYQDSGPYCGAHNENWLHVPLRREAADRIEMLEAFLRTLAAQSNDYYLGAWGDDAQKLLDAAPTGS